MHDNDNEADLWRWYVQNCTDWSLFRESQATQSRIMELGSFNKTRVNKLRRDRMLSFSAPACYLWNVTENDAAAVSSSLNATWRAQFLVLTVWQHMRCAICELPAHVVDHDHDTGHVRGLLCANCNILEGLSKKLSWLARMYREESPAVKLGLSIKFSGYVSHELKSFAMSYESRMNSV